MKHIIYSEIQKGVIYYVFLTWKNRIQNDSLFFFFFSCNSSTIPALHTSYTIKILLHFSFKALSCRSLLFHFSSSLTHKHTQETKKEKMTLLNWNTWLAVLYKNGVRWEGRAMETEGKGERIFKAFYCRIKWINFLLKICWEVRFVLFTLQQK